MVRIGLPAAVIAAAAMVSARVATPAENWVPAPSQVTPIPAAAALFMPALHQWAEPIASLARVGGWPSTVAASDRYVYVGNGSGVTVIDVVVPSAPRVVAESAPLAGLVQDLVLDGDRALVAVSTGYARSRESSTRNDHLVLMRVGGAEPPATLGAHDLASVRLDLVRLTMAHGRAFALVWSDTDQSWTIDELDVTGNSPLPVSSYPFPGPSDPDSYDEPMDILLLGHRLLVSEGYPEGGAHAIGHLWSFDASTPGSLAQEARLEIKGGAGDLVALGTSVLVQELDVGFAVVTAGTPGEPALVGNVDVDGARGIAAAGSRAYALACEEGPGCAVHGFDLTNPAVPRPLGSVPFPEQSWASRLVAWGNYSGVVDAQFIAQDWELETPSQAGSLPLLQRAYRTWVVGDRAVVFDHSSLAVVDLAYGPEVVGRRALQGGLVAGAVDGGKLLMLVDGRLEWLDPRDPTLTPRSTLVLGAGYGPLAADDGLVAVALSEPGQIHLVDASGPILQHLSSVSAPNVACMLVNDGRLYAWTGSRLLVFDITDPRAPSLVESLDDYSDVEQASAYDDVIFASGRAFLIYDAVSPDRPVRLKEWGGSNYGDTGRHAVIGNSLLLAAPRFGAVNAFDLSDPRTPARVGQLDHLYDPIDIGFDPHRFGRAVVADNDAGLRVVRVR